MEGNWAEGEAADLEAVEETEWGEAGWISSSGSARRRW